MGFIFTFIEFIWCLLLKSHAYGKAHIRIQILGFVCDVIIAIFWKWSIARYSIDSRYCYTNDRMFGFK